MRRLKFFIRASMSATFERDVRRYGWTVALRAVASTDGMTADVFEFPMKDLLAISAMITNRVPAVGRVVYDVSSKPPATIECKRQFHPVFPYSSFGLTLYGKETCHGVVEK